MGNGIDLNTGADLKALTNRLEVALRAELAAQQRLTELLASQEAAVRANDSAALADAVQELGTELSGAGARHRQREAVLVALAARWGIAAGALTLGSVIERLGDGAGVLPALRAELRDATATAVRANRRVSSLVRVHRRAGREILETLLAEDGANPLERSGALVDAEV